jgi:hypothetical protein
MAEVTVELGRLLDRTNFRLFDFDYQFDDTNFKAQLEQQIIDYYYDYEIGFETPDMFKRKFKTRWNRMISYYNKLYNTTLLQYNPLSNYKIEEVLDQLATNNNTQTTDMATSGNTTQANTGTTVLEQHTSNATTDSNTTTNNLSSHTTANETNSDYPQQPIAGGNYASGASTGDNTTTNTGTVGVSGTQNNDGTNDVTNTLDTQTTVTDSGTNRGTVVNEATLNTDYTKTIEGITGITYPELIEKHRDILLRINDRIIEEMKPCFILVF